MKKRSSEHLLFDSGQIAQQLSQLVIRDLSSAIKHESQIDSTLRSVLPMYQESLLKKFARPDADSKELEDATFVKFRSINKHMSGVSFSDALEKYAVPLKRARNLCHLVLGSFSSEEWFASCKHSQGSSIGVPYRDTSVEAKFGWPISVTDEVKPLVSSYLAWDQTLASAIDHLNADTICETMESVEGSRATTVPKSDTVRRMIAIEPTWNMFFQQGLMSMMYERLKVSGLDVAKLPYAHTSRAFEASITGKFATIDFSSASDCVHTELLRWLFPPQWFRVLNLVRSKHIRLDGVVEDLHMFSTMGNATTFPIETLVFWSLACAAHSFQSDTNPNRILIPSSMRRECSVFGDDCIIPSESAGSFMELASSVGFIVNHDKSFTDGRFRESCGGDYHTGRDVRPLFLKGPTSESSSALEPWLYILLNSLLKKYKTCFGVFKYLYGRDSIGYLMSLFRENKLKIKLVPEDYPDDSGLKLSGDLGRFRACYGGFYSPIKRNHHGTYSFQYCAFRYKRTRIVNPFVRYALALKAEARPTKETPFNVRTREKGGYVVGKGKHDRWSCPPDQRDLK